MAFRFVRNCRRDSAAEADRAKAEGVKAAKEILAQGATGDFAA